MSSAQKTFGIPNLVTIEGVEYTISLFDRSLKARFERWCKSQAWKEVKDTKEFVSEQQYRQRYQDVTALICSGYYEPGNAGFEMKLKSLSGLAYQTYLMIAVKHPEVTTKQVKN